MGLRDSLLATLGIAGLGSGIPLEGSRRSLSNRASLARPRPFLLQLQSKLENRQVGSFVLAGGSSTACQQATTFLLVGSQLYAGGELVTASEDAKYQVLVGLESDGSITDGFSIVNDSLQWEHSSFADGKATFCLSSSNMIVAVFNQTRMPSGCSPVTLTYIPYAECFLPLSSGSSGGGSTVVNIYLQAAGSVASQGSSTPPGSGGVSGGGGQYVHQPQGQRPGGSFGFPGSSETGSLARWQSSSEYVTSGQPGGQYFQPAGGPSSPPGYIGAPGTYGSGGPQRYDYGTSPNGNPVVQGPPGPAGSPGTPGKDGKDGKEGQSGKDGKDGTSGEGGRDGGTGADGRAGRDGKDGAPGVTGGEGPAGRNGTDGSQGPAGAIGPQGSQGPAGPTGVQGAAGPTGVRGAPGATGAIGATGATGAKGDKGEKGDQGVQGDQGRQGEQGPVGAPGTAGAPGEKGEQGEQGPEGLQGPQGGDNSGPAYARGYGYIGCWAVNNNGQFGLAANFVAQQVLTTSIDDCAAFCTAASAQRPHYFSLGSRINPATDSTESVCTCGDTLTGSMVVTGGFHAICNNVCTFPGGDGGTAYCGGNISGFIYASVFQAI